MTRRNCNFDFTQKQSSSTFTFLRVLLAALLAFLALSSPAHAAQITLAWDASTQPEVTGYKIYWGTSSGNYSSSVDAGDVTTYTVSGLNSGTTYYFVATCYTGTRAESGYSNQVSTTTPSCNTAPVGSNGSLTVSARQTTSGKLVATDADGNLVYDCSSTTPFGPTRAMLGVVDAGMSGVPLGWDDPITENPELGESEIWEIHNYTMDAHPIHLHEIMFEVVERQSMATGAVRGPEPSDTGVKDTVTAYPDEITRIRANLRPEAAANCSTGETTRGGLPLNSEFVKIPA